VTDRECVFVCACACVREREYEIFDVIPTLEYEKQYLPRMQRAAKDALRNSKLYVGLIEGNCTFKQVVWRSEVLITDLRSRGKTGRGITDTISC
jgi:hypothetical protein